MKLVRFAALATLAITASLAACAGPPEVRMKGLSVTIDAAWERRSEAGPGDGHVYAVSGKGVDLARGNGYQACFRDSDGRVIGRYSGTIPPKGPLRIPAPAATHMVDWATELNIDDVDFDLPDALQHPSAQGLFHAFRSTKPESRGPAIEFGLALTAADLDDALDRADEFALHTPTEPTPANLLVHYILKSASGRPTTNISSVE